VFDQVVVAGDRIGVVTIGGSAHVKEGSVSASWVDENDGVAQLTLGGDRIGIRTTAGSAYVKEGSLSAAWVHELDGVEQIALDGDRVRVLNTAAQVYVKEGAAYTPRGCTRSTVLWRSSSPGTGSAS